MLSGTNTHHRPVGCCEHPAGCRFIAFPASFYTMPRQKSSDSSRCGTVFQPLPGCQLQFHPCAGGASVPLWSMGTACRPIEEYMGRRPHWRVFGRCRGIRSSRPPGADVGRALAPLYPSREKSAAGGQTATGAGRVSVPPLSLSLKGTRRASGGMSRRAVRAPGSAARQVPG